ncbi:MAG: hypothetical protein MK212_14245 [Saprospiraceae bacterium]|nr:hypothetical protein [Saprospiraceae bacterium]
MNNYIPKRILIYTICLIGILLYNSSYIQAQRQTRIRQMSTLVLPPDYSMNKKYPLLVLMPYTGGSARDFFNKYLREAKISRDTLSLDKQFAQLLKLYNEERGNEHEFILMMPQEAGGRRDHSWAGFAACIERYENRVKRDVEYYSKQYNIDRDKIFLAGVSLGGDLSWALSMRNADFFQGAMITGSRCSYPPDSQLVTLAAKDYHFFLTMGMEESWDRMAGIQYAKTFLDSMQIDYVYREMPGLAHNRSPLWLFFEGLDFTMFGDHQQIDQGNQQLGILLNKLEGRYFAHMDLSYYSLQKDNDLLARGDALLIPDTMEHLADQSCLLGRDREDRLIFSSSQYPELIVRVSPNERGTYSLEVMKNTQKKTPVYQGIAMDVNRPREHGVLELDEDGNGFFALDFEHFLTKNKSKRVICSLFMEIGESP